VVLAEDVAVDVADQELVGALGSSAGALDGGGAAHQRPDLGIPQLGSRRQGGQQPVLRSTDQVPYSSLSRHAYRFTSVRGGSQGANTLNSGCPCRSISPGRITRRSPGFARRSACGW
jgi:hypothetical protein